MKILFIMLFVSSCTMFQKKPNLPGNSRNRIYCVKEFLGELSTEEAINICKFINEEK